MGGFDSQESLLTSSARSMQCQLWGEAITCGMTVYCASWSSQRGQASTALAPVMNTTCDLSAAPRSLKEHEPRASRELPTDRTSSHGGAPRVQACSDTLSAKNGISGQYAGQRR
jgi:hypothetical protein